MSDFGKGEGLGGKPPKGKKKEGEGSGGGRKSPLSKAIGKIHLKKGKKKEEERSPLAGRVTLSDESGRTTKEFLKSEAVPTSTPVKSRSEPAKVPPVISESERLKEAEITPIKPPPPDPQQSPAPEKAPPPAEVEPPAPSPPPVQPQPLPEQPPPPQPRESDDSDNTSMETALSSAEPEQAQNGLKKECLYKILVIGELGTGKTSIIKRYVHQFFSQHYRATIGVDFALKVLNWDQNTIIRLQLWDIAGQERFGNMTRVYYKEALGAFIVFDVTRAATFDAVVKWKQDLDAKVQLPDGSPIPCVLLANKCDQQKEGLVNNASKMNEYCEEHKFTAWFETSAKENINIEEAAKTLVDQIVRNDSSNEHGKNGARDLSKFPLESSEDFSEGKSCSC